MPAPTITSATLNKASYATGELMILTVTGQDLDEDTVEVTVTLRTSAGESSEPVTVTAFVDQLTATASDPDRTWTAAGRVGDTFTLTATA